MRGSVGVVGHITQPAPSGTSATAVHGLGGMGKTELALAYAHAFAWDYPGGRWLARCEGLNNFDLVLYGPLRHLGNFAEAEALVRRALAIDEQSLGSDHPRVAVGLNNLASLLQETNRLSEAEPLMRRALEIDEQSFDPDHPNVATALNNLAQLLQATNRLAEAEPLMRRVVEIFLRFTIASGHEHPHLQAAIGNYAALLEQMGYNQAQVIAELDKIGSPFGIQFGSGA